MEVRIDRKVGAVVIAAPKYESKPVRVMSELNVPQKRTVPRCSAKVRTWSRRTRYGFWVERKGCGETMRTEDTSPARSSWLDSAGSALIVMVEAALRDETSPFPTSEKRPFTSSMIIRILGREGMTEWM